MEIKYEGEKMKKKIPLQVLETIESYVNLQGTTFDSVDPNEFLLKFVDKDNNSDFYFNVETYKMENDFQILIDFKPSNKQTVGNRKAWIRAEQLEFNFTNWLKILEGYDSVKTVFDDPIIKAYSDEYYTEFEIIDKDADTKPFATKQILLLDDHLEGIQMKIDNFQTKENNAEIEKIKENIQELRNNLTKKSKKWVLKKLSNIWAKITNQGPNLMKEFLSEAKKQAIKEGVKFLFENGGNLLI
ncbi:hypothetical protein [Aquirufa ecclesiirivi]|uniref:hypothetical protein n=1 Tax=Aquirufa ecclesiirivi TaxID=2715124 RepID=UPI0023D89447|nr:hypothetical protein [Aquirufa ecclesiirivi]MDF0694869.1 hypothetical protein [Aquirufa ecclesiirivi]